MPIRPSSCTCTCTCPKCSWSHTVVPSSDALMPGEVPVQCPACGHAPLRGAPAQAVASARAVGGQALGRLWRR